MVQDPRRLIISHDHNAESIRVSLAGSNQTFTPEPFHFVSPISFSDLEELRWYLEDYLLAPYAVYEHRGQAVQNRLSEWGNLLFESVFRAGSPGRDAYLQARNNDTELTLVSNSPEFLSLPWELLQDPTRYTPLALALAAINRSLSMTDSTVPVLQGETLRVLLVIARPGGLHDIGYQLVARPLVSLARRL